MVFDVFHDVLHFVVASLNESSGYGEGLGYLRSMRSSQYDLSRDSNSSVFFKSLMNFLSFGFQSSLPKMKR